MPHNVDINNLQRHGARHQDTKFRLGKGEKDRRTLSFPRVDKGSPWEGAATLQPAVMGVELEIGFNEDAPRDLLDKVYAAFHELDKTFVFIKHDGSLGGQGVEIVSAPATLSYHKEGIWDKFFDELSPYLKGATFTEAGIHIHINKYSFTPATMAKFHSFINNPKNKTFLETIAGRPESSYARFAPDRAKITSINRNKIDQGDKYRACNISHSSKVTAEIRMFASTADKATFLKNIEFLHNLRLFCFETSIRNLDASHFIAWLSKNPNKSNRLLRAFLDQKCEPVKQLTEEEQKKIFEMMKEKERITAFDAKRPRFQFSGERSTNIVFTHK